MNTIDEGQVEAMLTRAREGLSPLGSDRARVRAAVDAALVAGPVTGASTDGARSPGLASSTVVRGAAKVLLGVVAAGAMGGTGYLLGYRAAREESLRRPAVVAAAREIQAPAATGPVVLAQPATIDAAPKREVSGAERRRPAHAARTESASTEPAPEASLSHELQALRAVDRALREGRPHLARALLQQLEREIPGGRLLEERQASLVMARCLAGETAFGVDPAEDFREAHPDSVYLSRVQQACAASSQGSVLAK